MTFGNDFSFVGNQYHLEIYDEEFFPDLVFFNRELNALVVVELKMGDFKPSYLGQLCFILLAIGEQNKTLFIELTAQQSFLFRAFFYFKFNIPIFYCYR